MVISDISGLWRVNMWEPVAFGGWAEDTREADRQKAERRLRSLLITDEPDRVTEPQSATEDAGESGCRPGSDHSNIQTFASIQNGWSRQPTQPAMNATSRWAGNLDRFKKPVSVGMKWAVSGDSRHIEWHIYMRQRSAGWETVPRGKRLTATWRCKSWNRSLLDVDSRAFAVLMLQLCKTHHELMYSFI